MPPLKDDSVDYRIERPNQHNIHEAQQFEYDNFSDNCALLRCRIAKIEKTASSAQIRANEVHEEADAEVINIKAELDYTTLRHKYEKEEMLASFHRALEVEWNKMTKVKDQHEEDMENERKKMIKLKDQHEDECNKNKMRVHDLFYSIKCNTGAGKEVVDLKGYIQLIQKEFSDAGAKIKDLKIQLHSTEKKHSIEKQELTTDINSAEKKHVIETQELNTQKTIAEKKHLVEKQELKTQQNNAEKKHIIEKKELQIQQNNAEKKHSAEKQELKTQQKNAEKKYLTERQEIKTQQNNTEKKHGREKQELKTQLNNAEKTRLVEVQELNEKLE